MRAAMYYANDDVRIVDLPKPLIGPGEILVKVRSSGICGGPLPRSGVFRGTLFGTRHPPSPLSNPAAQCRL